jgi:hypothetical protein
MLIVQVDPTVSVAPHVFPVRVKRPPALPVIASSSRVTVAVPLFLTVTTLVTGARGEGMVKVSVRISVPESVPLVALV